MLKYNVFNCTSALFSCCFLLFLKFFFCNLCWVICDMNESEDFLTMSTYNVSITKYKHFCFFPRFFDTSKQAIGALFIHFANIFLSTLTKNDPCSLWVPVSTNMDGDHSMWLIGFSLKGIWWTSCWTPRWGCWSSGRLWNWCPNWWNTNSGPSSYSESMVSAFLRLNTGGRCRWVRRRPVQQAPAAALKRFPAHSSPLLLG